MRECYAAYLDNERRREERRAKTYFGLEATMLLDADMRVDRSAHDTEREIEVTPEMIEAGLEEMRVYESGDSWESLVREIYLAMVKLRHSEQGQH